MRSVKLESITQSEVRKRNTNTVLMYCICALIYINAHIQYINTVLVFLFLTSLCVIDSSFTDLIRTDSDGLFYTAE